MHMISIYSGVLVSHLNNTIGRVLTLCGINGVYVTEKPGYMLWISLGIFLILVIAMIFWCFLIKTIIERLALFGTASSNGKGAS